MNKDGELESYLMSVANLIPNSQGMAKTKQMARKTDKRGLSLALGRDQQQCQQTTPPELDSDSSLEREYHSTSMGSKGGTSASHGRRGRSASPVPVRSGDRKRQLETDDESSEKESSEESLEESSEESTSQPPAKKPKGKNTRQQLKTKPLRKRKPQKREDDMTARELIAHWNRMARVKKKLETLQGWLKKTQRKRDGQNKLLCQLKPGTKALHEICFYQRCQTFLIPVSPFHRVVRQICIEMEGGADLRRQSTALFVLQCSTEAYMAGFFRDANLCAIHRKVITVNKKDVWLVVEVRGREHVGGRPQVSNVGSVNAAFKGICLADPSDKKGVLWSKIINDFASEEDWCSIYQEKVALDVEDAAKKAKGKGKGKGKEGMKCLWTVLKDAIHDISRAAICQMAHHGGVMRISGNIYEEVHGILKAFLEEVIKDVVIFCQYNERKTATTIDVIYALKRHGHHLYGFTC